MFIRKIGCPFWDGSSNKKDLQQTRKQLRNNKKRERFKLMLGF